MTIDPRAIDALINNQRQLDADGVEVGVSRQALDELLDAYHKLIAASPPAEALQDGVEAVRVKAEIVRLMREEFDPRPPNYGGPVWDDDADAVADKIVALFSSAPAQEDGCANASKDKA